MQNEDAARRLSMYALPACLAAQIAGILLGRMAESPVCAWIALGLAGAAAILLTGRSRRVALLLAVCAVGAVTGWYAYHPPGYPEGECIVRGMVCDELTEGDNGQVKTRLCAVTLDGIPVPSDAFWSFYPEDVPPDLRPGCTVTFAGRAYTPSGAENPGGFNFREYLLGQGIACAVYGDGELTISSDVGSWRGKVAGWRHMLLERLSAVMGAEAGNYAAAMLLGAKQRIPVDDQAAFSRLGAAHVLVVSGFHVGVLAMMLTRLLSKMPLVRRSVLSAAVITAYAVLTGAHAPVVRALLLYILVQIGKIYRRPRPLLWALCACAGITLFMNPAQLTSASFQLSYAAVLGMAVVSPWIPMRGVNYTLGAQVGVMLPVLYYFHELPLLGVLLNIVLLPAASALIALYWLTLLVLPLPPLAAAMGALSQIATNLFTGAIRLLNTLPFASLWTCQANVISLLAWSMGLAALSPMMRLHSRTRAVITALCTFMLLISVMPLPHTATEYILFSEGAADASLLWDKAHVMIIDAGEDGRGLSEYLHQRRLSVDTLVLTHLHIDHAGGLRALLDDEIPIRRIYLPWGAENAADTDALLLVEEAAAQGAVIMHLARGDVMPLPSGQCTVLWPEAGKVRPGADANSSALALRAEIAGVSLLLTADVPGAYSRYIAVPADSLKAAHHGAAEDSPPDFLAAVSPAAVLVSCGRSGVRADFGSIPVYDTHTCGAVTVALREGEFTISPMRW